MNNRIIVTLSLILLAGLPVLGSGFGVYEQGVQGQANAGAFVARAEDGSAIYYNPAGLARARYEELAISGKGISSRSYYSNAGQTTWTSEFVTDILPSLFWNKRFGNIGVGLASTTTYDYELTWDDPDYPGRFLSTGTRFNVEEHLAGIGFNLGADFSIGASLRFAQLEYAWSNVLVRPLDAASPELQMEAAQDIEVDGDDLGFTIGLQYYRSRRFSIGASYQSPIKITADGTRSFQLLSPLDDIRAQNAIGAFQNAGASTVYELPEKLQVGFSSRITVRTRLEVDAILDKWSTNEETRFETTDNSGNPETLIIPRSWDDGLSFRVGADFQQRKALLWQVGLGTVKGVVPSATFDPDFPDHDRFMYSFGVNASFRKRYVLEAAWNLIQNRDRKVAGKEYVYDPTSPNYVSSNNQEGLFESQRIQLHLGLRIRFGQVK